MIIIDDKVMEEQVMRRKKEKEALEKAVLQHLAYKCAEFEEEIEKDKDYIKKGKPTLLEIRDDSINREQRDAIVERLQFDFPQYKIELLHSWSPCIWVKETD